MMRPTSASGSKQKVLAQLKTRGPQSAFQLARRMGVTAMAVRQHLYRLRGDGLVDYADERRKVGRPARIWRLTPAAAEVFPDNHRELTQGLIDAARSVIGEEGLRDILAERTRRQLAEYRARMPRAGAPLQKRVAALAAIRSGQGYMAEWLRERDGSFMLAENHCPIRTAASCCERICGEELALFQAVLGRDVAITRDEHILRDDRRCAYRISRLI